MTPLQVLPLLTTPWIASEVFVFRRDAQPGQGERRDVGSRLAIFLGIGLGISFAFRAARMRSLPLPGDSWWWVAIGAAIMLAGVLFRLKAVRTLGEYFRTEVTLLDEHRLVTSGLYATIRHPAYTGGLMTCVGLGLATGDAIGLAAMIAFPGLAFLYRIKVEERALADRFGEEWQAHCARTAALIPGIW